MPATATRLIGFTEVVLRTKRSPTRVRQWVAAGRLVPRRVDEHGRRWFDAEDADRLKADADSWQAMPPTHAQPAAPAARPVASGVDDRYLLSMLERMSKQGG